MRYTSDLIVMTSVAADPVALLINTTELRKYKLFVLDSTLVNLHVQLFQSIVQSEHKDVVSYLLRRGILYWRIHDGDVIDDEGVIRDETRSHISLINNALRDYNAIKAGITVSVRTLIESSTDIIHNTRSCLQGHKNLLMSLHEQIKLWDNFSYENAHIGAVIHDIETSYGGDMLGPSPRIKSVAELAAKTLPESFWEIALYRSFILKYFDESYIDNEIADHQTVLSAVKNAIEQLDTIYRHGSERNLLYNSVAEAAFENLARHLFDLHVGDIGQQDVPNSGNVYRFFENHEINMMGGVYKAETFKICKIVMHFLFEKNTKRAYLVKDGTPFFIRGLRIVPLIPTATVPIHVPDMRFTNLSDGDKAQCIHGIPELLLDSSELTLRTRIQFLAMYDLFYSYFSSEQTDGIRVHFRREIRTGVDETSTDHITKEVKTAIDKIRKSISAGSNTPDGGPRRGPIDRMRSNMQYLVYLYDLLVDNGYRADVRAVYISWSDRCIYDERTLFDNMLHKLDDCLKLLGLDLHKDMKMGVIKELTSGKRVPFSLVYYTPIILR